LALARDDSKQLHSSVSSLHYTRDLEINTSLILINSILLDLYLDQAQDQPYNEKNNSFLVLVKIIFLNNWGCLATTTKL